MNRFLVYALIDPRNDLVRYIGKSTTGMRRPRSHKYLSNLRNEKTHKANWIRSLVHQGLQPAITVLETFDSEASLSDAERFWIAQGRGLGWHLTNATKGGDGSTGYTKSAETRAKIGAKARGRVLSAEARVNMSLASKARVTPTLLTILEIGRTPEVRARVGAKLRGRKRPQHLVDALREKMLGRTFSEETRAKMRAAKLGKKQPAATIAKRAMIATGKRRTPETRAKMRQAQIDRRQRERLGASDAR